MHSDVLILIEINEAWVILSLDMIVGNFTECDPPWNIPFLWLPLWLCDPLLTTLWDLTFIRRNGMKTKPYFIHSALSSWKIGVIKIANLCLWWKENEKVKRSTRNPITHSVTKIWRHSTKKEKKEKQKNEKEKLWNKCQNAKGFPSHL